MTRRPAGPRRGHTAPMQEIHAHVDIGAPASVVWGVLVDLGMYRRCNPLIRSVPGPAVSGSQLEIMVAAPPGPDTLLRLAIVQLRRGHGTTWLEWWSVPGACPPGRRFRIEPLPHRGVRFHHGEQVCGIMVPLLAGRRRSRRRAGSNAMNAAPKLRGECAWAQQAPAND